MRIAINALSARAGGGLIYLSKLISHLREIDRDNEYYIFVTRSNREKVIQFEDPRFRAVMVNVGNVGLRVIYEQTMLPFLLRRLGVDVVYAPADLAPLFAPCKVVLGIQNSNIYYPGVVRWGLMRRAKLKIQRWLASLSAKKATKVIFMSKTSAADIGRKLNISEVRRVAIWHGVETDRFSPGRASVSSMNIFPNNRVKSGYILYVSNMNRHKNFEVLLKAYSMLEGSLRDKHQLLVVGRISKSYLVELSNLAQDLGCAENLIFAGEVTHENLPSIYRNAILFVLPSILETFGIPIIEAMASGVPVIASSASVLPEIVGDAGLLFDPKDPSDLARKIIAVIGDERLRNALIEKGLQRARLFTWERCARETLAVFEGCLDT